MLDKHVCRQCKKGASTNKWSGESNDVWEKECLVYCPPCYGGGSGSETTGSKPGWSSIWKEPPPFCPFKIEHLMKREEREQS
jgi:hypothetical protein